MMTPDGDRAADNALFDSMLNSVLNLNGFGVTGLGSITSHSFVRDAIAMLGQDDAELVALIADQIRQGESETLIREYSFFLRKIDEEDLKRGMLLVQSVRMSNLPWEPDYSAADSTTQSRCVALMNVVSAMDRSTGGKTTSLKYYTPEHSAVTRHKLIPVLTDTELEEFIFEHPEESPRLAEMISVHGVTEFRLLRALLEGAVPSLASGSL